MTEFSRAERRWVWGFAFVLILLTTVPYLLAAASQDGVWVFSGLLFGVEDGHSYIAKMLRGAQGEWLFRSPYSTLSQAGALIYLPYLVMGKLFGPGVSHSHLVSAFHAFRILSILALCWAIYAFASLYLEQRSNRRLALALASLGGGLGWLLLAAQQTALDFYSPETFGFLAIFGLPHLVLARALLLWGLAAYLRGQGAWRAAVLWLALALSHLLTAAIGLLVLGLHLLWIWWQSPEKRKGAVQGTGWAILGAAPVLAFNAYQYLRDPFLQGWGAQNQISSPAPWHYLLAYGLPLAFAYWGWRRLHHAQPWRASLLGLWLLALPILLYLPFGLQRRFAEGAWVALLVLALAAFEGGLHRRWRWSLVLLAPSTALLWLGALGAAGSPQAPVFLPADRVAANQELGDLAEFDQVLLAGYGSGNAAPAWAPLRVVIGHGPETVGLAELAPQVQAYYQAPQEQRELLQLWGVDFVLVGPEERALAGGAFQVPGNLELVYDQGSYQLYRVTASPVD